MAVKQQVVRLRIRTVPLTASGSVDPFDVQLQAALDAQTASGTNDWKLAHILEGNVSAQSSDFYLIFEEDTP